MLGGLLVRPALSSIKKLLDPSEQGAAVLLGVNGLVLIGHGRSDALGDQERHTSCQKRGGSKRAGCNEGRYRRQPDTEEIRAISIL